MINEDELVTLTCPDLYPSDKEHPILMKMGKIPWQVSHLTPAGELQLRCCELKFEQITKCHIVLFKQYISLQCEAYYSSLKWYFKVDKKVTYHAKY